MLDLDSVMTLSCPICGHVFDGAELQQPAGVGGGSYCPKCQGRIYISFPHGWLVGFISFVLAVGFLVLVHVTSILWFLIGTVLIWIPLSLLLNVWSTRFKPATFKKWEQSNGSKSRRKTFFEWLYDRDSTPTLFKTKQ